MVSVPYLTYLTTLVRGPPTCERENVKESQSTLVHVLSSSSSLDISPKVADNFNDPRGTNKDVSHANFSKNSILSASPHSNLNDEEYFQQLK